MSMTDAPLVVLALEAITFRGEHGTSTLEAQREVIESTAERLAGTTEAGHDVVLAQGNAPQVVNLLGRQDAAWEMPELPLHVLHANVDDAAGNDESRTSGHQEPRPAGLRGHLDAGETAGAVCDPTSSPVSGSSRASPEEGPSSPHPSSCRQPWEGAGTQVSGNKGRPSGASPPAHSGT